MNLIDLELLEMIINSGKCFDMTLTSEELSSLVSLTERSQDVSDGAYSLDALSSWFLNNIK